MQELKILKTKDEIRKLVASADDRQHEYIDIPEWSLRLRIQSLTARERDRYEATLITQKKGKTEINMRDARARIAVLCVVDEDGNRVWSEADVEMLTTKSANAMNRIFLMAKKLSGIGDSEIEDLEKNSLRDLNGDLPSD